MELSVPAYNTYRIVTANPKMVREMLIDFFTIALQEREAEDILFKGMKGYAPKPIDHNKFAHALGFPSYKRMDEYCRTGQASEEAKDLIEYGRSVIESDCIEQGLRNLYNPALTKLVLNSIHGLSETIDMKSSDGSMSPAAGSALPPELTRMMEYLHDGSKESETEA